MKYLKLAAVAVLVLSLLGGAFGLANPDQEKLKVAFIYIGDPGDMGWTHAHDQGRKYLEEKLPYVETAYQDRVPDSAEAERRIRIYARQGYDLIFTTSWGYHDDTLKVAKDFPEVKFMHCSGFDNYHNMGNYFGRMFQPRYLSGLAAGMVTETNHIGYVAAKKTNEVKRGINAFARGVREVNSQATVHVKWTGTWYNRSLEKKTAESLVATQNVDVLAQHQDSPATQKVATEAGIYSVGYDSPMGQFNTDGYLTAPIWNWGPLYVQIAEMVHQFEDYQELGVKLDFSEVKIWKGLKSGIVGLDEFGKAMPEAAAKLIKKRREQIIAGDFEVFPDLTDQELLKMDYLIEGVKGEGAVK